MLDENFAFSSVTFCLQQQKVTKERRRRSIGGKWFLLMQLDAPEPRVAVKLPPETGIALREQYNGVQPAYHMNKRHWNDLYLNQLPDGFVKEQIKASYNLVVGNLPKRMGLETV